MTDSEMSQKVDELLQAAYPPRDPGAAVIIK
jgi:hypothetical protein